MPQYWFGNKKAPWCGCFFSGEDRIRTHDLLTASQALRNTAHHPKGLVHNFLKEVEDLRIGDLKSVGIS